MSENNNIVTQLRQWLRGNARRSEEAKLDRAAQSDDFLRDAMDGYRAFPASDHADRTDALRQRIRNRAARDRNIRVLPWMRVAAGVFVVLLAVGGFYYLNQPSTPTLAERETVDGEREIDGPRSSGSRTDVEAQDVAPPQNEETQNLASQQDGGRTTEGPRSSGSRTDAEAQDIAPQPATPVRSGRIVDTAGRPVPGVELRTPDRSEVIALSDAQGRITIDTAVQRLIVKRTGFQPVQWPVERSAAPYLQLQPSEEAAPASYSLKSRVRSAQEAPVPVAYPSVGYDSLRQWLQERSAVPRRRLPFSFTVHQDGRLSNVVPAGPEDADYATEIFSLLQQGPVWVLPPGVDSIRVSFQF